jgi:CHAT domain-containing protein
MKLTKEFFFVLQPSAWITAVLFILLFFHGSGACGELTSPQADIQQGLKLRDRGDYAQAAQIFEQSLNAYGVPVSAPALPENAQLREGVLPLLYWTALCYLKTDSPPGAHNPSRALHYFLELQQAAERKGDISSLVPALYGQARCWYFDGDYTEALKALDSCERQGLQYIEPRLREPGIHDRAGNLARVVTFLLKTHMFKMQLLYDTGRYDVVKEDAKEPAWQNLFNWLNDYLSSTYRELADPLAPGARMESISSRALLLDSTKTASLYESSIFNDTGMACRETGDYEHASERFTRACESLKAPLAESLSSQARHLERIRAGASLPTTVLFTDAPPGELEKMCTLPGEFQIRKMLISIEHARALLGWGKYGETVTLVTAREHLVRSIPSGHGYIQAWFSLLKAQALCCSGAPCEALPWALKAREEYGTMPCADLCFISSLNGTLGESYESLGRREEALSHFEHAFDTMSLFNNTGACMLTPARRYENLQRYGQGAIRIYRAMGRHQEAFMEEEKLRHAVIGTLWGEEADLFYTCGQDLMRMRGHASLLKKQCEEQLFYPHETNAPELKNLNSALRESLAAAKNLEIIDPGAFSTMVNSSGSSVKDIQKSLDPETALLVYYYEKVSPRRSPGLVLQILTDQAFKEIELTMKGSDLEQKVTTLNQRLCSHSHLWNELGSEFYEECIAPARQILAGKRKLVIVPDGIMYSLPFSLLQDPREHSLMETYAISYAPSASAWTHKTSLSFSSNTVVVKDLPPGNRRTSESSSRDIAIPLSRFTKDGFAELALSPPPGTLYRLSVPCVINAGTPSLSGFQARYGKITLYDLFTVPVEHSLIIADDCTTTLNGLYRGSETGAFTGTFFQAGAEAVLFSLWQTPPGARDECFSSFRDELKSSGSPEEALRAMQTAIRKKYPLPFYWAPYVLYRR